MDLTREPVRFVTASILIFFLSVYFTLSLSKIILVVFAGWLVVLGFNAILTAMVSWLSHTSPNATFLSKATDYFSHMLLQR